MIINPFTKQVLVDNIGIDMPGTKKIRSVVGSGVKLGAKVGLGAAKKIGKTAVNMPGASFMRKRIKKQVKQKIGPAAGWLK